MAVEGRVQQRAALGIEHRALEAIVKGRLVGEGEEAELT